MKPIYRKLIVKVTNEEDGQEKQLASGLFAPSQAKATFWEAEVLARGEDASKEIEVGDRILIHRGNGLLLDDGSRLIEDTMVIAVIS